MTHLHKFTIHSLITYFLFTHHHHHNMELHEVELFDYNQHCTALFIAQFNLKNDHFDHEFIH